MHEHFNEELYFFLLAVKPFDEQTFVSEWQAILSRFQVTGYCMYQVFGNFDLLGRVWLPAGEGRRFVGAIREKISNLQEILAFQVEHISHLWWARDGLPSDSELRKLDRAKVANIQSERPDPKLIEDFEEKGMLHRVAPLARGRGERLPLKVFLCLTPQHTALNSDQKRRIRDQLHERVHNILGKQAHATFHEGLGFAWLLIKVVVNEFYQIGELVRAIAKDHNADGIATSTFIVLWYECPEGDAISGLALDMAEGRNRRVYQFLPELYAARGSSAPIGQIEGLLLQRVLVDRRLPSLSGDLRQHDYELADLDAIHNYLAACLIKNYASALTAIFPRIGDGESRLRRLLPRAAEASFPGGQKALGRQFPGKPFGYLALGDALEVACVVLDSAAERKILVMSEEWSKALPRRRFEKISDMRNRVTHFGAFDPTHDCTDFADRLLDFFDARDLLVSALEQLIEIGENQVQKGNADE